MSFINRVVVADADDEALTSVGGGGKIENGAFVNGGIRHLHEIAVEGQEHGSADI